MKLSEFYKEQYFYELSRKDGLERKFQLRIGFVILLLTAFSKFLINEDGTIFWLCCLGIVTSVIGLLFLVISHIGKDYNYMPYAEQIKKI